MRTGAHGWRACAARAVVPQSSSQKNSHQLVEDRRRRVADDILGIQALHVKLHLGLGWFAWDRGRGVRFFFHVSVRQIQLGREARALASLSPTPIPRLPHART